MSQRASKLALRRACLTAFKSYSDRSIYVRCQRTRCRWTPCRRKRAIP